MPVSREVDLTLKSDFKGEKPLKGISIKNRRNPDYRRYHRVKSPTYSSTTYSGFSEPFNSSSMNFISTTGLVRSIFDSLDSRISLVEERVCWRKITDDPDIFEQHYSNEEYREMLKNRNFAMGDKYDRAKVHYNLLKETERNRLDICERCGKRFNLNNCLSHSYSLCQKCYESLFDEIRSVRL